NLMPSLEKTRELVVPSGKRRRGDRVQRRRKSICTSLRDRREEPIVAIKYCSLDSLERLAWLDAELVDERGPRLLISAQRVALPPWAVERRDELCPPSFPERLRVGCRREVGHRRVVAERQAKLRKIFLRGEIQVLEPGRQRRAHRGVTEVRELRVPPERE